MEQTDIGISTRGIGGTTEPSTDTTASLSLSTPNMTSTPVSEGGTAIVSTSVTVDVVNAESYSLTLSVDNANLTNGSTTIVPGNAITDNTWGYKWDNASTYTAPSTAGTTLTNSTLAPLDSNGAVSFTKTLTFAAKFTTNADAGTYHGSGTVNLVATPKVVTLPQFKITYMPNRSFDGASDVAALENEFATNYPPQTAPDDYNGDSYTFTTYSRVMKYQTSYSTVTLKGWKTASDSSGTSYDLGKEITVRADNPEIVLYADWKSVIW